MCGQPLLAGLCCIGLSLTPDVAGLVVWGRVETTNLRAKFIAPAVLHIPVRG